MWKPKKRCPYCSHVLGADGLCYNDDCCIGKTLREQALKEKEATHPEAENEGNSEEKGNGDN